jgi:arabinoxylan arabinofuranohydrolase
MRGRSLTATLSLCVVTIIPTLSRADNPIVQTNYTADPAPLVHDGRLYLYTTHDEDVTVNNFFTMNDWRVYSTTDVVNWTDHGSPLSYRNFTWARGDAWAGQCIYRNGKFYFYVPVVQTNGGNAIGVATSTSPTGPFADALGRPLTAGGGYIDPTVYIDDDGQAYLYWGNPDLFYVKLNADMISFQGSPIRVNLTTAGFGTRKDTTRATGYEEGPWFYKRGALYYIVYPANGIPEDIWYTTSSSPTGPWTYRGIIMRAQGASFTNHQGLIDYKGSSYFFYHNGALPGGGGYKRSVAVERFTYNADGTIPTIAMTTGGPPSNGNLNPYFTTEAETIAWESGVETEVCSEGGMNVTSINNGDYIKVKAVDFGTGAVSFDARVAAASSGGSIELRLDSQTGTLVGTCAIQGTGGAQTWATRSCAVTGATGIHDLFLRFTGGSGDLFKFNWWRFTPRDPLPDAGTTGAGGMDGGVAGAGGSGSAGQGGQGGFSGRGGGGGLGGGAGGRGGSGGPAAGGSSAGGAGGGSGTGGASAGGSGGSATGGASAGGSGGSAIGGTTGGSIGSGGAATGAAGAVGSGGVTGSAGSSATGTGGGPPDSGGPGGCSCAVGVGRSDGLIVIGVGLMLVRRRRRRRPDGDRPSTS